MKFPYGLCNFNKIITKGYLYIDRTDRIPLIESAGENLLFLRPRRFGKSLLLSMLQNYYDIGCAEKFEQVFGNLAIGRNPTSSHNQYFILKFDFSCVDPTGLAADIKKALYNHINSRIEGFILDYEDFLKREIRIDPDDALVSLNSLISVSRKSGYPIYLLIDEYDNFANEVMMGSHDKKAIYKALVFEEGPLKTFFKTIKSFTDGSGIDRIFITGVSPVVMSDITSGYNIGNDIFLDPDFNDLCGFTEKEIVNIIAELADECGLTQIDVQNAVELMRTYYNGYLFSPDARMTVFNPTLAIYFMKAFCKRCKSPRQLLDANLAMDEAKLQYISQISGGRQMILDLVKKNHQINVPALEDRFGISDMLSETGKDTVFMASFLYYFGVLTIESMTRRGKLALKVPNLVMQGLYIRRLKKMLLPEPVQRDEGILSAEQLYTRGNIKPLCEYVEKTYFSVFHNRDLRWANELTVKTAFLSLLYNDLLYIMDSEHTVGSGYSDLTMIIRPDMRNYDIFDILIEFKYIPMKETGLTREKARNLKADELKKLPIMVSKMKEASGQAAKYSILLKNKYKNLDLKTFAVVSLGFERLQYKEII